MTEHDWWASAEGRSTCRRCGEQPPGVQEVADSRGVQNYCSICSASWWVSGPITLAEYKALPRIHSVDTAVPEVGTTVPERSSVHELDR